MNATRACSIDGCERPRKTRGWCNTHYESWRREGHPGVEQLRIFGGDPYERFMSYVDTTGGPDACHLWLLKLDNGYGRFNLGKSVVGAHRWILGYLRGKPLAPEEHACHRCDNRQCVNPAHLYVGTPKTNMRDREERGRGAQSSKVRCPRGHAYDEANTRVKVRAGRKSRECRECERARRRVLSPAATVEGLRAMVGTELGSNGTSSNA